MRREERVGSLGDVPSDTGDQLVRVEVVTLHTADTVLLSGRPGNGSQSAHFAADVRPQLAPAASPGPVGAGQLGGAGLGAGLG